MYIKSISILLFSLTLSCATNHNQQTAKVKTSENLQEEKVKILAAIDSICGDTWCEGDYDYRFLSIQFDTQHNTTGVFFNVINEKKIYDKTCIVEGYSTADQILTQYGSLDNGFYDKLNICISAISFQK